MATSKDPSLGDLAAIAIANSPALQTRVSDFVDFVLDEAEDLIANGSPKMKADMVGKLIPHLVRQLADKAEDEDIKEMRREMELVKASQRDSIGGKETDVHATPAPMSDIESARVNRVLDQLGYEEIPTDSGPAKIIRIQGTGA